MEEHQERTHPEDLWEIDEAGPGRYFTFYGKMWKDAKEALERARAGEPKFKPGLDHPSRRTRAGSTPQLKDSAWLDQKYWKEGLGLQEIADLLGVTAPAVWAAMKRLEVPRRGPGRPLKEPERIDPNPVWARRARGLVDGIPCGHPGCLNHATHPCEGCGRIGGIDEEAKV